MIFLGEISMDTDYEFRLFFSTVIQIVWGNRETAAKACGYKITEFDRIINTIPVFYYFDEVSLIIDKIGYEIDFDLNYYEFRGMCTYGSELQIFDNIEATERYLNNYKYIKICLNAHRSAHSKVFSFFDGSKNDSISIEEERILEQFYDRAIQLERIVFYCIKNNIDVNKNLIDLINNIGIKVDIYLKQQKH